MNLQKEYISKVTSYLDVFDDLFTTNTKNKLKSITLNKEIKQTTKTGDIHALRRIA